MAKLSLYYPARPYIVTQGFGILNPSYEQFGFSKHNGIDIAIDEDGVVRAMCDGVVIDVGFNSGAGNYVKYRTNDPIEAEGRIGYVQFMYMHADHQLVSIGQKIEAGTALIVADNTGFSTGPHTHISAYFVNEAGIKEPVGDPASDYCFDHSKYFNGSFSDDLVVAIQLELIAALKQLIALFKKK